MAINKNFVVKNGLEVSDSLIFADALEGRVGVGTTTPKDHLFHVFGGIGVTDAYVTGITTIAENLQVGPGGTVLNVLASPGIGNSVGIGNSTPEYLLDVRAPVSTGQTAFYVRGDARITGDLYIRDDLTIDELSARNIDVSSQTSINFLSVIGVSTFASNIDANHDLNVIGISTFESNVDINDDLDVDGRTELDTTNISETLNVVGISTFASNVDINSELDVEDDAVFGGDIRIRDEGTTNIFLMNDGAATFSRDVQVGAGFVNGGGCNLFVSSSGSSDEHGAFVAKGLATMGSSAKQSAAFMVNDGIGTPAAIFYDGSATFAGGLLSIDVAGAINTSSGLVAQNKSGFGDSEISVIRGLNAAGTHTSEIFADGSATFAGSVESENNFLVNAVVDGQVCFRTIRNGVNTALINGDGSATFAGTVDANALTVNGVAVDTSAQVDAKIAAIPPTDLSAYDTSAEVTAKVAALETSLTDGAPGALDTLNELAASLGDDSNFAGTVTNSLAGKADLSGATFSGETVVNGGFISQSSGSTPAIYINDVSSGVAVNTTQLKGDGSAKFAGYVNVADYAAGTGIRLNDWGEVISRVDGAKAAAFSAYQNGLAAGDVKARIYNDGSAEFAGHAVFGGALFVNAEKSVSPTGANSIVSDHGGFTGIRAASGNAANNAVFTGGYIGNTTTSQIFSDGSAEFAGSIKTTATNNAFHASAGYSGGESAIRVENTNAGGSPYYLYCDSSDGKIAYIKTDGSASLAGGLFSNYVSTSTSSGSFNFFKNAGASGALNSVFGTTDGTQTIQFYNDGSATFAGPQTLGTPSSPATNGYTSHVDNTEASTAACFSANNHNAHGINFLGVDGGNGNEITSKIMNDGSVWFARGNFQMDTAGVIQTNLYSAGTLNIDSSGSFGSPKIVLNASNGNATFSGSVESKNNFFVNAVVDDQTCFRTIRNGVNTSYINGDGSATFAGTIKSTTWPTTGYEIESSGALGLNAAAGTSGNMFALNVGGTQVASITGQGIATFAGSITAAGYDLSNLQELV
jgi:hypothetical protein